jgi:FMN reductase
MPPTPYLVGLGGSLRPDSRSRTALSAILQLAAARGHATELLDLRELSLPMFIPEQPLAAYAPGDREAIERLHAASRRATHMLWASPTYHGTLSGAFKNALDILDMLGDDQPPYLRGRTIGLIAISSVQTFGAMEHAAYALNAWVAPTRLAIRDADLDAAGAIVTPALQRRAEQLLDELFER